MPLVHSEGLDVNHDVLLEGGITANIDLGWVVLYSPLYEFKIKFLTHDVHLILTTITLIVYFYSKSLFESANLITMSKYFKLKLLHMKYRSCTMG